MEVCIGNIWGTVCHTYWDSHDARVVCRQQGFEVDGESEVNYSGRYALDYKMECTPARIMQGLDIRCLNIIPIAQVQFHIAMPGMDKGLGPYF